MRKYFLYHLKERISVIITLSVLLVVLYFSLLINPNFLHYNFIFSHVNVFTIPVSILCLIVPLIEFSFKMNKQAIIKMYALPLRKEKLYLVRFLVGYLTIIIPFTIGFFLMMPLLGSMYTKPSYVNTYFRNFPAIFLLYPLVLGASLLVYSYFSFFYTRGNRKADAIVTLILSITVPCLIAYCIYHMQSYVPGSLYLEFNPFSPIRRINEFISNLVFEVEAKIYIAPYEIIGVSVISGIEVISLVLFILTSKYHMADDARNVSSSWFGLRVLIPVAGITFAYLISKIYLGVILLGLMGVFTYLEYALYVRSLKLNYKTRIVYVIVAAVEIIVFIAAFI